MPGQVAALRRRIELLTPTHDRLTEALARALSVAPASTTEADIAAADRAAKQANRIKAELAAVGREIETLRSLVDARLSQTSR
jgi:hypothetical protein